MYGNVPVGNPICCPPIYCVRDFCTPCIRPVIQPVVNVNRQHIVNVPQVIYQPVSRNVVVPSNNFVTPGTPGTPGLFNTGLINTRFF